MLSDSKRAWAGNKTWGSCETWGTFLKMHLAARRRNSRLKELMCTSSLAITTSLHVQEDFTTNYATGFDSTDRHSAATVKAIVSACNSKSTLLRVNLTDFCFWVIVGPIAGALLFDGSPILEDYTLLSEDSRFMNNDVLSNSSETTVSWKYSSNLPTTAKLSWNLEWWCHKHDN